MTTTAELPIGPFTAADHHLHTADTDLVVRRLGDAFNTATEAASALEHITSDFPADGPVWALVDAVRAARHLKAAARLIDAAAARCTAAEADQ